MRVFGCSPKEGSSTNRQRLPELDHHRRGMSVRFDIPALRRVIPLFFVENESRNSADTRRADIRAFLFILELLGGAKMTEFSYWIPLKRR
jgi:hypothetical protein